MALEALRTVSASPGAAASPWYLAFTKPRQESVAFENLQRQGFEAYLPLFKRIRRGQAEPVFEPMFPRYLFLRPTQAAQSLSVVRSTRGVASLVRFGIQIAALPCGQLDRIRELEALRNSASVEDLAAWRKGQAVVVSDGPLKGLEGIVLAVASQRVVVLFELLGRPTPVGVGHEQLLAA